MKIKNLLGEEVDEEAVFKIRPPEVLSCPFCGWRYEEKKFSICVVCNIRVCKDCVKHGENKETYCPTCYKERLTNYPEVCDSCEKEVERVWLCESCGKSFCKDCGVTTGQHHVCNRCREAAHR